MPQEKIVNIIETESEIFEEQEERESQEYYEDEDARLQDRWFRNI